MLLRFQTKVPDPESGRPRGILVAAASLRDSNEIQTLSPGTIVYEDGHQMVAIPRRNKSR